MAWEHLEHLVASSMEDRSVPRVTRCGAPKDEPLPRRGRLEAIARPERHQRRPGRAPGGSFRESGETTSVWLGRRVAAEVQDGRTTWSARAYFTGGNSGLSRCLFLYCSYVCTISLFVADFAEPPPPLEKARHSPCYSLPPPAEDCTSIGAGD